MPLYSLGERTPRLTDQSSTFIAPTAVIIGDVVIGRDASIWFGAVLRGDNEPIIIGDGSNIQENTVMHTDPGCPLTIGKGCTIGHKAMLHGCTVHDNSLVGMGATILNRAVINENCLIGAHALIPEGKTYPANSLIMGTPGKVARSLTDENVKGLQKSAKTYRDKIQLYRNELKQFTENS